MPSAQFKVMVYFLCDIKRISNWRSHKLDAQKIINEWIQEDRIKNHLERQKGKRVAVLTGATSGLGVEVALALAKADYKLIILARDEELATEICAKIKEETKNEDISFVKCDLSSLDSVRQAANEIISKEVKIDLLISNNSIISR